MQGLKQHKAFLFLGEFGRKYEKTVDTSWENATNSWDINCKSCMS